MTDIALIEPGTGRIFTYQAVQNLTDEFCDALNKEKTKQLVLLYAENQATIIAAMKGAQQAGHAVMLCDPTSHAGSLGKIISQYQPDVIISKAAILHANYSLREEKYDLKLYCLSYQSSTEIHRDLALLISTSGSTGSSKYVRLSHNNVDSNRAAIIDALSIQKHDRTVAHMPLAYSFGLSVINSHLEAGASIVLMQESMTSSLFWKYVRVHEVTSLYGVPTHFEILKRLNLQRLNIPSLKILAQAGGRLSPALVTEFARQMMERDGRFFVMYGQTEASPRMTVLPSDKVLEKAGSVGIALHQGTIRIIDDEIIYHGPNVMMGYAENRIDLRRGDDLQGRLATGDIGYCDQDGYLYVTGRKNRFTKIDGIRVNLDELEILAGLKTPAIAEAGNDAIALFINGESEGLIPYLSEITGLHGSRFTCQTVGDMPLLSNGKIDRQSLRALLS